MVNTKQSCFFPRSSNTDLYLLVRSTHSVLILQKARTHTNTHTYILPILVLIFNALRCTFPFDFIIR